MVGRDNIKVSFYRKPRYLWGIIRLYKNKRKKMQNFVANRVGVWYYIKVADGEQRKTRKQRKKNKKKVLTNDTGHDILI